MYYSPPKSSVWGHSLRRMKPEILRARVTAFVSKAVSRLAYSSGSIFFRPVSFPVADSSAFECHFMNLLSLPQPQPGFSNLTEEQSELCFRELVRNPSLYDSSSGGAELAVFYTISAWKMGETVVATNSRLGVYYGAKALIIPGFGFETDEHFSFLQASLESVGLCKLNPKHVKGRKK